MNALIRYESSSIDSAIHLKASACLLNLSIDLHVYKVSITERCTQYSAPYLTIRFHEDRTMRRSNTFLPFAVPLALFFLTSCRSSQQLVNLSDETGSTADFNLNERYDITFFYIDTENDKQDPFTFISESGGSLIAAE